MKIKSQHEKTLPSHCVLSTKNTKGEEMKSSGQFRKQREKKMKITSDCREEEKF